MDESFTIQISTDLVRKLLDDGEKVKKARKPKPKVSQQPNPKQPNSDDSLALKSPPSIGWSVHPALHPPPQPSNKTPYPELDAVRSILEQSEKVVERLQKKEESMLEEVTRRAKELHDKEFKLPNSKPMPCVDEKDACLKCYKENINDPLKCARFVKSFADCARSVRQQLRTTE